ncbi:ATP-dependent metalloprotease FtsH [Granulicella mallensis MP5ACTX8]|uniref:ATP-dependent metalloprotease FtsH n=1 Tax=Granulicella mallensis (strain ATCC BAA-1857 / DSM 23137 / MP5ACTX8) TaxID=682795 RepID=G8NPR1_GRAMM|nr:ATP-dependent metalloprotease FtsH [Granulicella mallensis MP5ACTX8]
MSADPAGGSPKRLSRRLPFPYGGLGYSLPDIPLKVHARVLDASADLAAMLSGQSGGRIFGFRCNPRG